MRINIKPLSVNKVFQGRRFRTKEYDVYELQIKKMLSKKSRFIPLIDSTHIKFPVDGCVSIHLGLILGNLEDLPPIGTIKFFIYRCFLNYFVQYIFFLFSSEIGIDS